MRNPPKRPIFFTGTFGGLRGIFRSWENERFATNYKKSGLKLPINTSSAMEKLHNVSSATSIRIRVMLIITPFDSPKSRDIILIGCSGVNDLPNFLGVEYDDRKATTQVGLQMICQMVPL